MTLGPFENATISGLLKGPVKSSSYYNHVNVSVEPLNVHKEDGAKYCAVPGYTFLKPGSHRIHVMIKNCEKHHSKPRKQDCRNGCC